MPHGNFNMRLKVFLLFFFIHLLLASQTKKLAILKNENDIENYLYEILDTFLENPNETNLQHIDNLTANLWRQPKNKDEQLALVILLCNEGFYFNKFNQQTNAINSYEKAWSIYSTKKLNNYNIVEYCLKPLGNLYTILGDYQNAENIIKSYLFLSENNQEQKAAALINLSVVYQNTGRFNDAINILAPLLELDKINSLSIAKILSNIATNYLSLKQFSKSSYYLNTLKKLINKNNITDPALKINTYKLTALISINNQKYTEAETELKKIEKLIKFSGSFNNRNLVKFYLEYATFLKEQNQLDDAIITIEKALQNLIPNYQKETLTKENLYPETTFIDAFDLLASIYNLKNEKETALGYYSLSYKVEDLLNNLYQYEETKLIQLNDNRVRGEKCIAIYYELNKETKNNNYIHDAFLLAEKTKASILKETIIKRQTLFQLKDDTLALSKLALQKKQNEIKNELVREQLKSKNANLSYINQLIDLQNKTNLNLKNIDRQLKNKYPNLQPYIEEVNITDLKEKLRKDHATMIEYFYGKEAFYYFTINENEIKFSRIENVDKINTTTLEFISYFDNASKIVNNIKGYNSSAYNLYEALNLDSVKKSKKLIIIPDGVLSFVPFETLLTQKTESINFQNLPYLINEHQILYNTSASFYLDSNLIEFDELNILGIFPVFENSPQPLSYSINESEAIKKLFPGNYLMNESASKENFTKNISEYSILHLSTHANSGSFITPASIEFYDETMYLNGFYSLNINPKLVVLSACETGVGKLQKGEGALSVARGFQYSGANNLLFSLWKVNDLSTSQLMSSFYKNYKNNSSGYLSNHHAKLDYLKNKNIENVKKSPYYWSSFVFYGNLEAPATNYTNYILIITFILILLLLFIKFKNAKS